MGTPQPLRLTSVMGVARALISTVDVHEAVEILTGEFGWDVTFQALSLLHGDDVETAFGLVWTQLLTTPLVEDLRQR